LLYNFIDYVENYHSFTCKEKVIIVFKYPQKLLDKGVEFRKEKFPGLDEVSDTQINKVEFTLNLGQDFG
jgi:hypothetical protein